MIKVAISSGIFGFPKDRCAKILFQEAIDFYKQNPNSTLKEIRFVNFDDRTVEYFEAEFEKRFGKSGKKDDDERPKLSKDGEEFRKMLNQN